MTIEINFRETPFRISRAIDLRLLTPAQLRERIEDLEAELRDLRALLLPPVQFPREWELPPKQAKVLSALHADKSEWMTRDRLLGIVWGPYAEIDSNTLPVTVSKLRSRLRSLGFDLVSRRCSGYRLPDETRHAITKALEGMRAR